MWAIQADELPALFLESGACAFEPLGCCLFRLRARDSNHSRRDFLRWLFTSSCNSRMATFVFNTSPRAGTRYPTKPERCAQYGHSCACSGAMAASAC
eukprot:2350916-Pleurochrysis_carterae.AAC.2